MSGQARRKQSEDQEDGTLDRTTDEQNTKQSESESESDSIGEKKEGEARKRAHRLPDGWAPTDKLLDWAVEKVPDVNASYETEKFKDYFIGKGRTYVDWGRTWQNWMRKANEGGNHGRREIPVAGAAVERAFRDQGK
jgi:hypothetical protein